MLELEYFKPPGRDATYVWEVENFDMCPQTKTECIKSTPFYVDSMDVSQYQLILYPRGRITDHKEVFYCQLMCLKESDFRITVSMNATVGEEPIEDIHENILMRTGDTRGFPVDIRKKDSETTDFVLLPADLLTFRCKITPIYMDPEQDEDDFKPLSDCMDLMYLSGWFSDFCLIGKDGTRFPVHKAVLSIRCEEMAKLFESEDRKEAVFDAVSEQALDVVLRYLYSGLLKDNLPSDVLNDIFTMARNLEMDDLTRDVFPLEHHTIGRTIIKVDHHEILWDLTDFHERVEEGDWPVQTFVDLTIGRFTTSFSIIEGDDGKPVTYIVIKCHCLNLDRALTMKVVVLVDTPDRESRETMCKGEYRFRADQLDEVFTMKGDHGALYKYRSVREYPDKVALVFDFKVSHPRYYERCNKVEVQNTLQTPHPYRKRSLHRLSSDMDIIFNDCPKGDDYDRESDDGSFIYTDIGVVCEEGITIPAHRCVLAVRSEILLGMIQSNPEDNSTIHLSNVTAKTLILFLRYLYTGKLPETTDLDTLLDVYAPAVEYEVEPLANRCLQLIGLKASMENLQKLLEVSNSMKDSPLFEVAVSFIRRRKDTIFGSPEWEAIKEEIPDLASAAENEVLSSLAAGALLG